MNIWIMTVLRKVIFTAAAALIAKAVESGLLEQGQIDAWIEATIALLAAVIVACWSKWIKPWLASKFATK
jgi:ABC-type transport system involved in cytochrome bd biosynthesis fused ATPase/permease subunit